MIKSSDLRVTSRNVTLENCDREQIQYSNAVQPHAVLLVVNPETHRVIQASENALELGHGPALEVIGRPLSDLLNAVFFERIIEATRKLTRPAPPRHIGSVAIGAGTRDVFAHWNDGLLIVELERQTTQSLLAKADLYTELRGGIAQLNASTSVVEFLDEVVHVIARCTGFERVMAYRFQEDGSGEVVAEAVQEGLDRYLGLHYPAADIPKPARRLFQLTWVRHLPDVGYEPIPILPEVNPLTGDSIDLSYALSRSVSVMYTEYLKNMGVQATMVLTLFKNGKLWGLISCMHHSGPRHMDIEVRGICEMLAQTSSLLMSAKEDAEFSSYRESLSRSLQVLMQQLSTSASIRDALTAGPVNLISSIDACGAAVLVGDEVTLVGKTPTKQEVQALAAHIDEKLKEVWSSDLLVRDIPQTASSTNVSGVLAVRIDRSDLLLWFRPEYRETVSWAGDPAKLVVKRDGIPTRLHPNGSFDVWRTEVIGRSKPWLDCEIDFASKLGRGILAIIVDRSREVARLNKDLSRSNRELEEFVYTATHDLKSPLRGISSYAQLVLRGSAHKLEPADREKIETIVRLSSKMDGVIEGLLRYSELGHALLRRTRVDLNDVCAHAADLLRVEIEAGGVDLRVPRPLPHLACDARWVEQILYNLISNAIKYNDKPNSWVEVGFQESAKDRGQTVIYVKDNGIGVAAKNWDAIFRLFHRLHADRKFGGGTGLGLAIVSRAIERHNGRIWMESSVGVGTTFFFTLDGQVANLTSESI